MPKRFDDAEEKKPKAITSYTIKLDDAQMEKLQAGDRFYYLSRTQGLNLLNELEADSFGALVYRNTDIGQVGSTHVAANLFATPDLTIEADLARQADYDAAGQSVSGKDPVHANPILNTIRPLVIRTDADGNLSNGLENVQYTGDLHVVLGGTEANNVLTAGAGDDTVWGDGGNDRLEGGLGNDHLFGGADLVLAERRAVGAAGALLLAL